jgi:hypothetical protein
MQPADLTKAGLWLFIIMEACTTTSNEGIRFYIEPLNRASKDEVVQRVGKPHIELEGYNGESIWVYRSRKRPNDPLTCEEYRLTFGHDALLRNWVKTDC